MSLLSVQNLSVEYGDLVAVRDVSFHVEPGEVFVLLGANGAGKSSILRAISGLVPSRAGHVRFKDEELLGLRPHRISRKGIAHVPEGRRVFAHLSIAENLSVSYVPGGGRTLASARDDVFQLFGRLAERANQMAGTLSGGEQQMLAIGRALMNAPALLMLDEPSLGLSPLFCQQLFANLAIIARRGISMLLVEQNASALELADRGLVLQNGSIFLEGDRGGLMQNDFVRRAYLGM